MVVLSELKCDSSVASVDGLETDSVAEATVSVNNSTVYSMVCSRDETVVLWNTGAARFFLMDIIIIVEEEEEEDVLGSQRS